MMQQRKSKKILIYFFLLLIVGTINNINIDGLKSQNIKDINIVGLDIKDKKVLLKKIKNFSTKNIFSISKSDLINEIEANSLVEEYFIFKRYPSSIDINIKKTKFLAKINIKGKIFYLGSNGKFTKANHFNNQLPFIFGNPEVIDFFNGRGIFSKLNKLTGKHQPMTWMIPTHECLAAYQCSFGRIDLRLKLQY